MRTPFAWVVSTLIATSALVSSSPAATAAASRPDAARGPTPAKLTEARVHALLPNLLNGACPLSDVVTGGQIDSAGLAALRRQGVRTVLDLRAADEDRGFDERAVARAERLEYVALPVTAASLDDQTFARFRRLMAEGSRAPVLVHCASGNRVGAVMIPYLVLDRGLSVDSALAVARRGGLRSEPMTKKALDYLERHPRPRGPRTTTVRP